MNRNAQVEIFGISVRHYANRRCLKALMILTLTRLAARSASDYTYSKPIRFNVVLTRIILLKATDGGAVV